MMRLLIFLAISIIICSCKTESKVNVEPKFIKAVSQKVDTIEEQKKKEIPLKKERPGWVELVKDDYTVIDLRYATENNFVEEQMYNCGRCYVREQANESLSKIRAELRSQGYGIILYDCYRPRPVQQKLWDKVPNASYVTPPSRGSMHNRGVALDIGLINEKGEILDMGTEFDYFGREGHHDYYDHPKEVLDNRTMLKSTMEKHNFASIRTEWWHYSYIVGEYEIADWLWDCQ